MKNKKKWIEWASYNLAYEVDENDILNELIKHTKNKFEASKIVDEIKTSPIFTTSKMIAKDVAKWSALADAHMSLESQIYTTNKIPHVSSLSAKEFHWKYYCSNQPVIITDIVNKWPALRKWNLDYLSNKFGNNKVTIQSGRKQDEYRDCFVDRKIKILFSKYIDQLKNNKNAKGKYLIAHDRLLEIYPFNALMDDITFDPVFFMTKNTAGRVFFWLGPIDSETPMHRDLGNVYLSQIMGEKKVKLISAKALHLIYNETGYHSEVDFDNIDYDKFPRIKKLNILEEVIKPGELLFIPLGWWHSLKSLNTTISITGNNFAFKNSFNPIF